MEELFFDVKTAFLPVEPHGLQDTLHWKGFYISFVNLISYNLTGFLTLISFGDYESNSKVLSIGIPQQSPLLVILYVLYNLSLIPQALKLPNTPSINFIDDVASMTADKSISTVQCHLQIPENQEMEWGNWHREVYDKKTSQWMIPTHFHLHIENTAKVKSMKHIDKIEQKYTLGVWKTHRLTISPLFPWCKDRKSVPCLLSPLTRIQQKPYPQNTL